MPESASLPAPSLSSSPHHRWRWWLLSSTILLLLLVGTALLLLDPWLKHKLEKQVATQTHGQYALHIGSLHTSIWRRSLTLRQVQLQPARTVADTMPRISLRLAQLGMHGVGLWALLRRQEVPIDSLGLDSLRIEAQAARQPIAKAQAPLHQRLPLALPGVHIQHFSLQHCRAVLGSATSPLARWQQADLTARDLLISATGAADTQRLAYAAAWQVLLQQAQAQAAAHQLRFKRLSLSTRTQVLELDSLRVAPPAPGQGKPGAVRIKLNLPHLILSGWQAAALQHAHRFRADSLSISNAALTFWPPAKQPPPLWQLLRPITSRSDLVHLHITNGFLRVAGLEHAPQARDINVDGTDIRVDSTASVNWHFIAYARSWLAHTGRLTGTFDAPFYQASIQHLHANTDAKTLRLTGLRLTPKFSPAQMNQRKRYQAPQLSIRMPELLFQALDYSLLAHKSRLSIGRLQAPRPWVQVASDGRGPINSKHSVIVPEAIQRIGIQLTVNRFDITNGILNARYRSPRSPLVGTLRITRFRITLRNFSNDPARIGTPLTGTATAYLQDRCRMQVSLRAPLNDPQGRHRIWGSFGASPFAVLNSITAPTRFLRFDRGNVHHIAFDMNVNQQQIDGTMQAEYSGLKMSLLKYKDGELKQPLLAKIGSGLANKLVIRDENPRPTGRLVVGTTRSRREPRFSIFVLWRQGIISGLMHSIGLPQPLAQKLSQSQDKGPLPGEAQQHHH